MKDVFKLIYGVFWKPESLKKEDRPQKNKLAFTLFAGVLLTLMVWLYYFWNLKN